MNLITGATGIVGAHVALKLLEAGETVVAIKRSGTDISKTKTLFGYYTSNAQDLFDKIKWIEADINDIYSILDALEGIDTVYHCAGFVSFDSRDDKKLFKINAEGTANVVNACLEKNIKTLCHVSSIATLQNPDITSGIDESVYWKSSPRASAYAISKYNAEREVWRGVEEGLNAVIVNPGIVLSPGFWNQSSGTLFSKAHKGMVFYTEGSTATIDARDVATCMIELVKTKQYNKRFVLIENNYSYKEILSIIHQQFSKKTPSIKATKWLLNTASFFEKIVSMFSGGSWQLSQETISSLTDKNTYNNNKIVSQLSYNFIPLHDSVKFICKAYSGDLNKSHA